MTWSMGILFLGFLLVGLLLALTTVSLNALQRKVEAFSAQVKDRYKPGFMNEMEKKASDAAEHFARIKKT